MADAIVIGEFHLTVFAPCGLRETEYGAIRRALDGKRFQARLVSAIRRACRRSPALRRVTVRRSR